MSEKGSLTVFSGTGMSRMVADWIGEIPGTDGYVLPVYGWRIPKALRRALRNVQRSTFNVQPSTFTWAVFTCGDSCGNIDLDLEAELGVKLDAAFSVVMPETYLAMPFFRLDPQERRAAKLAAAEKRCREIREALLARRKVHELGRGLLPGFKTRVIGGFFERFLENDRSIRVDAKKCVKCGKCAAECPTGAIETAADGLPRWKHDGSCTCCFRCYHHCPGDAIEFGRFTRGKGRLGKIQNNQNC